MTSDVSRLLLLMYQSVEHRQLWPEVLAKFCGLLHSDSGALHSEHLHGGPVKVYSHFGGPEMYAEQYQRHYAALNPLTRDSPHLFVPGQTVVRQAACSTQRLETSEFYCDFLRPLGVFEIMGAVLRAYPDHIDMVSFLRARNAGEYDDDERATLQELVPHLQQAVRLSSLVDQCSSTSQGLAGALHRITCGVILLDERGKVRFMNSTAESLARPNNGFSVHQGHMETSHAGTSRVLREAVTVAVRISRGEVLNPPSAFSLPRVSGSPLTVSIYPLAAGSAFADAVEASCVLLIADPDASPQPPVQTLRDLFHLTAAEARVLLRLLDGDTLKDVQDTLCVSMPTVKTHLSRILSKTETRSQSDLVRRILLSLPPAQ